MSSERGLWCVLLAASLLGPGCRNLVQETPLDPPTRVGILARVVQPSGAGVPAEVWFENNRHVEREDRISGWVETDGNGLVESRMPWGRYDIWIRPLSWTALSDFWLHDVDLGATLVELRYDLVGQPGRLLLPASGLGFVSESMTVTFYYGPDSLGSFRYLQAGVSPSGRFEAFLPGEFSDPLFHASSGLQSFIRRRWRDGFVRSAEELVLDLGLTPLTLELTMGAGRPLPLGVEVVVEWPGDYDNQVRFPTTGVGTTIDTWRLPGLCQLWIGSSGSHYGYSTYLDASTDPSLAINVGEFRVELWVEDASGNPLPHGQVWVYLAQRGSIRPRLDTEGKAVAYLHEGDYLLRAQAGDSTAESRVTIDSDASLRLVVQ